MKRSYYSDSIENFVKDDAETILGSIIQGSDDSSIRQTQIDAWLQQIKILQPILPKYIGSIYFEYSIPRMGERVDVLLLIEAAIFVVEFKVGARKYSQHGLDQVCDYALDLKNFHSQSHSRYIAPILLCTHATTSGFQIGATSQNDKLFLPILSNTHMFLDIVDSILSFVEGAEVIDLPTWEKGTYSPTPTIVEAAKALYKGHSVAEISRSDAAAVNLHQTSKAISDLIRRSNDNLNKTICFVTGVPGAGKTLVGLNIATQHLDSKTGLFSVLLSGNGPLVQVLQEGLARDKIAHEREQGNRLSKKQALSEVKAFIQNIHHYRDDCIIDKSPPADHVALFDEAQRAWNLQQTSNFMRRVKNLPDFNQSEPEFLISCIDRHPDWGVIVCLIGGGQEINTGEAGISEWIDALNRSFPDWHIHISDRLTDSEYGAGVILQTLKSREHVYYNPDLHLQTSMRSFRSEHVSMLVKQLLDLEIKHAQETLKELSTKYPIVLTRSVNKAKLWIKQMARGSERYGIVVSSQAERLKPYALDVKSPVNPIHWFLGEKNDVRSSYFLESVATEFHIQGLELDWVCLTWDADFRYSKEGWMNYSFRGSKWQKIHKEERQMYQKNAYRVLLTRARQGMVIVVPHGDSEDLTRSPEYYDSTFDYLKEIGFEII
ncbi:MAG: DUF2075 domain-containing protein [Verrucomicrobia bacterium]|nr:DUF2075 domain-containing protein [Verrucomicrobiota bacterium]